jgi:hypothetical protein
VAGSGESVCALRSLRHYLVHGTDGDVGRVRDVYFYERRWRARYLIVDIRHWLRDRRVLLAADAVRMLDHVRRQVVVALTRTQVEQSPPTQTAVPVALQHDVDLYAYFGFPYSWTGAVLRGDPLSGFEHDDPHLCSAEAMVGYGVRGQDGEVGHVEDFLVDVRSWAIRDVVVRSKRWPAHRLLISPFLITRASWERRELDVDQPRDAIARGSSFEMTR